MPMDYKTCRRTFIYLNKVKMAKKTLESLFLITPSPLIERMAKQRLDLLGQFQLQLVSYLMDCSHQLPFNPSERCRGVVFWFAAQKITETVDEEVVIYKMEMADNMMRSECLHLLSDNSIPEKLREVLEAHVNRIAELKPKQKSSTILGGI